MNEQVGTCAASVRELASPDDVAEAVSNLTDVDMLRLQRAAAFCLPGSAFDAAEELAGEAISQTYRAALGEGGRRWPKDVAFIAFLLKTIQGLASDSRDSARQRQTVRAGDLIDGDIDRRDPFDALGISHPSIETELVEAETIESQHAIDQILIAKVSEYFKDDDQVQMIMMGIQDDLSAAEIREIAGMNPTQYETAWRRFRRGLNKLFPSGRKP